MKQAPYPPIVVEGTNHALRHLPWLGVDPWRDFHRLAAFHMEDETKDTAEMMLYYFAIRHGYSHINSAVIYDFSRENFK